MPELNLCKNLSPEEMEALAAFRFYYGEALPDDLAIEWVARKINHIIPAPKK